jgi:hypothetical protein
MKSRFLVCAVAFGIGVVSACGGAADTGLFGSGGGSTNDSGSSADTGGGTHDSGIVGHDATTQPDSSPEVDAIAPMDATPPPPDSAPMNDGIHCEGNPNGCMPGSEVCCRKPTGTSSFNYSCVSPSNCNGPNDLAIPCSTSTHCPNAADVCCAMTDAMGKANSVQCVLAADCQGAQICGPPQTSVCVTGTCQPSVSTIPGYDICK